MFGGFNPMQMVMEGGMKIADYMHDEEMAEDAQQFAAERQDYAQRFNSAEALRQRDWQEQMASTSYQRAVGDMKKAGLNPMLAYHQGGAPAGTGATATSSPISAGGSPAASGRGFNFAAGQQTASQIEVNDAVIDRTKAEAKKIQAEEDEIRARTPTHAVSIEHMQQQIRESAERIHNIIEQTAHTAASAANVRQQTINLKETVPQIRATVRQLQALTVQAGALTGKTQEETTEIQQRIKSNLPQIQRQLSELEATARELDMPRREQDRAAHDRFTGALGALIRSLTGLGTYLK